jgi:hypothetical protein
MADLYQSVRRSSFGYRGQSDYTTAAATGSGTDWSWLLCEPPEITFGRDIEQRDLLESALMTEAAPTVGGRHGGTFTIRGDLRSQLDGYDATTDSLGTNPELVLIKEFFGGSTFDTAYDATDLTGVDADSWTGASGTYVPGMMYGFGGTGGASVLGFGVVNSQSGTAVELTTDTAVTAGAGVDAFGMAGLYPENASLGHYTFRHTGVDTEFDLRLIGCSPVSLTLRMDARKVPTYEMTWKFTSWTRDSSGGLYDPIDYAAVPPIIGDNNGRLVLDGLATVDGTVVAGTCNVGNVVFTVDIEDAELECHSAVQGVTDVIITRRTPKLTFDMPIEDTDISSNDTIWETRLEAATAFSLQVEVGTTPGACFGFFVPQLRLMEQPSPVTVNTTRWWATRWSRPRAPTRATLGAPLRLTLPLACSSADGYSAAGINRLHG